MPKKITKGSGMMTRDYTSYNVSGDATAEEAQALSKHLRQWSRTLNGPDATREVNAETCREILRRAGATPEDIDVRMRFGDDSAQYLAHLWLAEFRRVNAIRTRIECGNATPSDMETLVHCAEEMGKLQERMWWRRGVVSNGRNQRRREELMIGKLNQERSTRKAADKRKEMSEDREPGWWDNTVLEAKEIHQKYPWRTRWNVAGELASKVGRSQKQVAEVLKKSFWK